MAKGVFTTKIEPAYDDQPEVRYHFPRSLLSEVEQTVGDLIVYYEPRRPGSSGTGGRSAYFATALVERIEPDPAKAGHFYAYVSSFLEFPNSVPFRSGPHYWESALRKADGSTNRGRFGRSVRTLPSQEYEAIVREGMRAPPRLAETTAASDFQDEQAPFVREVREVVLNRKIRDQAFALLVRGAYDSTCAFTGLKLINGGGRSEIEAAHIQPVGGEHAGPDSVRNGLALSRTLHWMFDRGLMSLEDDGKILMAKRRDDDAVGRVRRLLHPDGMRVFLLTPDSSRMAGSCATIGKQSSRNSGEERTCACRDFRGGTPGGSQGRLFRARRGAQGRAREDRRLHLRRALPEPDEA